LKDLNSTKSKTFYVDIIINKSQMIQSNQNMPTDHMQRQR